MQEKQLTELFTGLDRFHRRWRQVRFLQGLATVLAVAVILSMAAGCLDFFLDLPIHIRYVVTGTVYSACLMVFAWCVIRPIMRRMSAVDVAWMVERRNPKLNETLVTVVQLVRDEPEHVSREMIDRVVDDALGKLQTISVHTTFPISVTAASWKLVVLALGAIWVSIPALKGDDLLARLIWPTDAQASVGTFNLSFAPKPPDAIVEGRQLTFSVKTDNRALRKLVLYFRYPDGRLQRETLNRRDYMDVFSYRMENLYDDLEYWAKAGKVKTQLRRLTVRKRPKIDKFLITYQPPSHAGLPDVQFESTSGDLKALANTNVDLTIVSSSPLSKAEILLEGRMLPVELSPDRRLARTRILVDRSGSYEVKLYDASGLTNPKGMNHTVTMIPDTPPQITVFEPKHDLFVARDGLIHIEWVARDDLRVVRQEVHCTVINGESYLYPLPATVDDFDVDLSRMRLSEGDELEVTLRAVDAIRQEAVSSPIRAVVLDTPGFGGAAPFRARLDGLIAEISEAENRLHDVQSSVQEVVLARGSNVRKTADLGHQLLMLDHRIDRVDKQLLRILGTLPSLFDNGFFPNCHNALKLIIDGIANQVVFGTYHRDRGIDKIKNGCIECRQLLAHSKRACELLKRHSGQFLVDALGGHLMATLHDSGSTTESAPKIRAKARLFLTLLPGDDGNPLRRLLDDAYPEKDMAKAVETFLAGNTRSMRDYSALNQETKTIRAFQKDFHTSLRGLAPRLPAKDSTWWRSVQRFRKVLGATRDLFVAQVGDWDVLDRFLVLTVQRKDPALYQLGIDAWQRMRSARFSLHLERLTTTVVSQFSRLEETIDGDAVTDSLDLLISFPVHGYHRPRQNLIKHTQSELAKVRTIAPNGKGPNETMVAMRQAQNAIAKLVKHDFNWRRLMRKAMVKKMPSSAERLTRTLKKLNAFSESLSTADWGTLGQLEQIAQELTTFALKMEQLAADDIAQADVDVPSLRFTLGVGYAILDILDEQYQPMTNRYSILQSMEEDELLTETPSLQVSLADIMDRLRELLALLEDSHAAERGELNFLETARLRQRSIDLCERILPPELNTHLNLVEFAGLTARHVNALNARLRKSATDPNRFATATAWVRELGDDGLRILDMRLTDRWRHIAIDSLNSARLELNALQHMLGVPLDIRVTPEEFLDQAQLIAELLEESEAAFSTYFPGFVGAAKAFRMDVVEPLETDQDVDGIFDGVQRARLFAGDMSTRVISGPSPSSKPPGIIGFATPLSSELASAADVLDTHMIRLRSLSARIAEMETVHRALRREGSGILSKIARGIAKNGPVRKRFNRVRNDFDGMTLNARVAELRPLAAELSKHPLAPTLNAYLLKVEEAQETYSEKPTLERQRDTTVRELLRLAEILENRLSDQPPGQIRNHAEFLIADFRDNLGLEDYDAAVANMAAFHNSLTQEATGSDYFSAPFVTPHEVNPRDEEAGPTGTPGPYALRALVQLKQQEQLFPELRQTLSTVIQDGQYGTALRLLPGSCASILKTAQAVERQLPKPEDVPRGFGSPTTVDPFAINPIPQWLFDTCAHALSLGNRQAVDQALSGNLSAAAMSMEAYAAAVPNTSVAVTARRLAETFRSARNPAVELADDSPLQATEAANRLAAVIDKLDPMPIAQLLVIKVEQGRVLHLIREKQYRKAALASFALSEWFQRQSLQEFWTAVYRLERLDQKLFGNGEPSVRTALMQLYPGYDEIRRVAVNGDLEKAAAMAENAGRGDAAKLLRVAQKMVLAQLPNTLRLSEQALRECAENIQDKETAILLREASKSLQTGKTDITMATLATALEAMAFPTPAFERLSGELRQAEERISRMKTVKELVTQNRFCEAIVTASSLPNTTDIVDILERANKTLAQAKHLAAQQALALRPVGQKSALRTAFHQASKRNLSMAYARAKAAGAEGARAATKFKDASGLATAASFKIDVWLKARQNAHRLEEDAIDQLVSVASDAAQRKALAKQLNGGFFSHAVRSLENVAPIAVKIVRVRQALEEVDASRRQPTISALIAPLPQHVRYLYNALFTARGLHTNAAFGDALVAIGQCASLLETSMTLAAVRGKDLLQRTSARRSQRRTLRRDRLDEGLTADRKAWIDRLEKSMALDGAVDGMALMSNFQIGKKRNYAGYYKAANRLYFSWLTTESKNWKGPAPQPAPDEKQ